MPTRAQWLCRWTVGLLLLPIWEHINDKLHDFVDNNPVIMDYDPTRRLFTRVLAATWAECVWWGAPVEVVMPLANGRRNEATTSIPRRRGGGSTVVSNDLGSQEGHQPELA